MASVRNDPSTRQTPSVTLTALAKKSRTAGDKSSDIVSSRESDDHTRTSSQLPAFNGVDELETGASRESGSAAQMMKDIKNQVMSHGGVKGLVMFKPLFGMIGLAKLSFIQGAFEQVRVNDPPLSINDTMQRMLVGATYGGLTMFMAGGIPLGIVGAALAAAGPPAFVLLGLIAALTVWGAVAGAYQAYKTSRPPKEAMREVNAEKDGNMPTTVTLEGASEVGPRVTLESIQESAVPGMRVKLTALTPPTMTVSATRIMPDVLSDRSNASHTPDATAATDNAATAEDNKADKQKRAFVRGLHNEADNSKRHRQD